MGAKKKKKGGKKSKKDKEKGAEGEEEKKEESADTIVPLPKYGWIKIKVSQVKSCNLSSNTVFTTNGIWFSLQLRLCNAPTPQYNWFDIFMLTCQKVRMIH